MKEIMCNYLSKRDSTYYFRRKTPLDLILIYGKEIIFSLNTKDRKAVESLTRKKAVEYDEACANKLSADQQRIRELERKLAIAKLECDILKKETVYSRGQCNT